MSEPPASGDERQATCRKRLHQRWWFRISIGLMVLLVGGVLLLPTILSFGPVTRMLLSVVNSNIPGRVSVEDLSVGWFSALRLRDARIYDPEGELVARVESIEAPAASITRLLGSYTRPGTIRIVRPEADIVQYEDGTTNLQRALVAQTPAVVPERADDKPRRQRTDEPAEFDVAVSLELVDGRVSYRAPQMEPLVVTAPRASLDVSSLREQRTMLEATVAYGPDQGSLRADVQVTGLLDARGRQAPHAAHIEAQVTLVSLPIAAVDRLAGLGGRLQKTIGPSLTASFVGAGPLEQIEAEFTAEAKHLHLDASLLIAENRSRIKPGSKLALTLTPEAWAAWTAGEQGAARTALLQSFDLALIINCLDLPSNGLEDLDALPIDAQIAVGDVILDAGEQVGRLSLRQTRLGVSGEAAGRSLSLQLSSQAQQNDRGGSVEVHATVRNLAAALASTGSDRRPSARTLALTMSGRVNDLPLAIVDELGRLDGLATAALGPVLNASLECDLQPADTGGVTGSFALAAHSDQLDADLRGTIDPTQLILASDSRASLQVRPELARRFLADQQFALGESFPVSVRINRLHAPMQNGAPRISDLAIDAAASVGDVVFVPGADGTGLGRLAVRDTSLQLTSPGLRQRVQVVASLKAEHDGRGGGLDLEATVTDLLDAAGRFNPLPHAQIAAVLRDLPLAVVDQIGRLDGLASTAIGPILNATVDARLSGSGGQLTGGLDVAATAQHLTATIRGDVREGVFRAAEASRIELALQPALVEKLTASEPTDGDRPAQPMTLAQAARVAVDLRELAAPLQGFDPARVRLGARLSVDQLQPRGRPALDGVSLRDLVVDLSAATLVQPIEATISGRLAHREQSGTIDGRATISNALADAPPRVDARVQVTHAPTELIDALAEQGGVFVALLADTIDEAVLVADARLGESPIYQAMVRITDDRLNTNLTAVYTPTGLEVRQGSTATVTITPEAWASYAKQTAAAVASGEPAPEPIELLEPVTLQLTFNRANVGLGDAGLDPARTAIDATLTTAGATLRQGTAGAAYSLRDLRVAMTSDNLQKQIALGIRATIPAPPGSPQQGGQIRSDTTVSDLYNAAGQIDPTRLSLVTDTMASSISVPLLDVIGGTGQTLDATLGDTAEARLQGRFPGDFELALRSPTAEVMLKPSVNRNRVVTLREDAVATLQVTPRMADVMLAGLNPVFGDAVASRGPVRLTLDRDRFRVPLGSDHLTRRMTMSGTLELGTLVMDRKGLIGGGLEGLAGQIGAGGLAGALGMGGGAATDPHSTYDAVFTPMRFSIDKGKVDPSEVWMTSPDIALGAQGRIDLVNQTVDMTLGLLGATLIARTHPAAAKAIDPNRVYEVTMSGPLSSPKLDVAKLAGSLAVGAGRQQLREELGRDVGPIFDLGEQVLSGVVQPQRQSAQLKWSPPPAAAEVVKIVMQSRPAEAPGQTGPLTPEQRRQSRDQRQQRSDESAQPQPTQPPSPLDLLLQQVVPPPAASQDAPPASGSKQPAEADADDRDRSPEARQRRQEERRRRQEERQQQQQQQQQQF